jgi:hypothetical protein
MMMDDSSSLSNPFSGTATMEDEETMTSNAGSHMEMISLGGTATTDNLDDLELQRHQMDDVHHDLPSVDEYKAGLTRGGASSRTPSKASADLMKENSFQRPVNQDFQDEPSIHDQLPSVDEIKMNGGAGTNHFLRNFALCVIAIAVIIAVAVPIVIMTHEDRQTSGNSLFGQSPRVVRLNQVHNYLDTMDVSKMNVLTTVGTPQYLASMWMAGEVDYQMEIPNVEDGVQNEFVERYALAVLFYATGGPGWDFSMNFLSSKEQHVCDWYSDFNTEDNLDEIVRLGVANCWTLDGTDRFVTGLALRKSWDSVWEGCCRDGRKKELGRSMFAMG